MAEQIRSQRHEEMRRRQREDEKAEEEAKKKASEQKSETGKIFVILSDFHILNSDISAGPRNPVGRALDSLVRGPGFDTQSGHILWFLLLLIQEGQLSVTGESMCTKYWLTA